MERKAHWYSVIQFCPDRVKGEIINIGLMLHDPEAGKLNYFVIDENNQKIKSILGDDVSFRTFKVQREYIDFYLTKLPEERDLVGPDLFDINFLNDIGTNLPNEFKISQPTFALTEEPKGLFDALLQTYVGEAFLNNNQASQIKNVKQYVREYFQDKNWIGTKIKSNVKLSPLKDIKSVHFQIDFVFKNGIWNLIQTVPSSPERLTEWFSKTSTMLDIYQNKSNVYVMYDEDDILNQDKSIVQMVGYLKKKDSRVNEIEIDSPSFFTLCDKVDKEAKDVSDVEDELLAM